MAQINNNHGINKAVPFMWALMTNKSTGCYQQIFQFIADNFEEFKPKYSMSDHELALRNALKLVFPQIETRTCYFHYAQALMKNANDHKIIDKTITSDKYPEIYVVLRRLKYLALLPPDYIVNTFHQIKNDCKTNFGSFFDRYLDYYAKQWLRAEGPEQISVYRVTENRTDNQLESYHKKINSVIKEQRPSHNLFLGVIKSLAEDARLDFDAILENAYDGREKTKETEERNKNIINFWNTVDNHLKDPEVIKTKTCSNVLTNFQILYLLSRKNKII
ncbi:uncharacterized protein LOC141526567 [Cotesia typhae]|uniref:uncharacterized protein LOC141526567 n=1 Tax=Cotesia typhae TaxID=2053667 RepID=UPI003D695286